MSQLPAAVHAALLAQLPRVRACWPGLVIDDEVFVPYVAARLADDADAEALARTHVDDLYLACGCVLADPTAVVAFEAAHGSSLRRRVARIDADAADDLAQRILTRLLVGTQGEPPRIFTYAGRSALAAWLEVVATREALMHGRKPRDPAAAADPPLADLVDGGDDPELALMRARYRDEFRRAFEVAFAELDVADRALLRVQLVDRLTIDELARLRGVHRATAARWIAKARERLLRATRRHLVASLNLSHAELRSLFRIVRSQLEVSVRRLLDA